MAAVEAAELADPNHDALDETHKNRRRDNAPKKNQARQSPRRRKPG